MLSHQSSEKLDVNKEGIRLNHIVCTSANGVIGENGAMPWHLPEDLKYFKKTTMGCPIIMGRKTFESIGRALPGRLNIVFSRNKAYQAEGAYVVSSLAEALEVVRQADPPEALQSQREVFIIGGGELYRQTLNQVDRVFLTLIHRKIDGDTSYGPLLETEFKLTQKQDGSSSTEKFSFLVYDRA